MAENREFGFKFETDEQFWVEIKEVVTVLQPAFDFTVRMQKDGYGMSEFYIGWLRMSKNLERFIDGGLQFDLGAKLLDHMKQRAPSLFKSPLFLSAVYLDPRIMFTLSAEQKSEAVLHLIKINDRITKANGSNSSGDFNDTLDEMQQQLQAQYNGDRNSSEKLIGVFSQYEREKPFEMKQNVMKFWEENEHAYKSIIPLVNVVHAVPANQCSTERAFSSLSYIRSKLRMSMASKNLSNVLMVRLNKSIYYALREERVQRILNS